MEQAAQAEQLVPKKPLAQASQAAPVCWPEHTHPATGSQFPQPLSELQKPAPDGHVLLQAGPYAPALHTQAPVPLVLPEPSHVPLTHVEQAAQSAPQNPLAQAPQSAPVCWPEHTHPATGSQLPQPLSELQKPAPDGHVLAHVGP